MVLGPLRPSLCTKDLQVVPERNAPMMLASATLGQHCTPWRSAVCTPGGTPLASIGSS